VLVKDLRLVEASSISCTDDGCMKKEVGVKGDGLGGTFSKYHFMWPPEKYR
jgi:hypothetical protein